MTTKLSDIPIEGWAFLDALAVGESGGDYTILYGGSHFYNYTTFPHWAGKDNSHAAGRYQFEPATWREQAAKLQLPDFSPASQDIAAWDLAAHVYERLSGYPLIEDLQAYPEEDYIGDIADLLQSTWTSLNAKTLGKRYKIALSNRKAHA